MSEARWRRQDRDRLQCSGSRHGEVAEWQTRTVQVRVPERAWGFNSPLPHQIHEGSASCGALASSRARCPVRRCTRMLRWFPAADGPGVACECRVGDRVGRSDRLRGGPALRRRSGSTSSASTTTCGRSSSAPRRPPRGTSSADRASSASAYTAPRRRTSATGTRWPSIFKRYGRDIAVVIHTAAQPSHDWAVRDPFTDFDVNAGGTLNVLQNVREHCIEAPFIHCSTNKVYGDRPNCCRWSSRRPAGRSSRGTRTSSGITRGHVDRRLPALGLRRLQGRRGRDGAGVRPLLRHEDRLLPGRHADRPGALAPPSCTASSAT